MPSPNKCAFPVFLYVQGLLALWCILHFTVFYFVLCCGQTPSHFLETILSRAVVVAMHRDSRWCQMTDGVGARFPVGGDASERAGRQLPGALPRSLAPRSRLALRSSQSRHTQGAVLSAPRARAREGGLSGCPPPLQIGWNLLGPQECSTVSTHFTSIVFLL